MTRRQVLWVTGTVAILGMVFLVTVAVAGGQGKWTWLAWAMIPFVTGFAVAANLAAAFLEGEDMAWQMGFDEGDRAQGGDQ